MSEQIVLPSGAECTIKKLTWKGYKPLRALLVALITGPITGNVLRLVGNPAVPKLFATIMTSAKDGSPEAAEAVDRLAELAGSTLTDAAEELRYVLPSLMEDVDESYGKFQTLILQNCVVGVDEDSAVEDVAAAVAKAIELVDLGKLVEMEKNSLAGIVKSVKTSLGTSPA